MDIAFLLTLPGSSQPAEALLHTSALQNAECVHAQLHVVKNWLVDNGWLDHTIRVPLILGIWGGKGQGLPPLSRHWQTA
jgi:hypothetical protein